MNNKKKSNSKTSRFGFMAGGVIVFVMILAIVTLRYPQSGSAKPDTSGEAGNPKIRYPCTGEGKDDWEEYESVSEKFAIGVNDAGYAVFKDPDAAFEEMQARYAGGIKRIQKEFSAMPLTKANYISYKNQGNHVTTGTDEEKKQAAFISGFLDIYENSYRKPDDYLWAVVDEVTESGVSAYIISEKTTRVEFDNCKDDLAAYDVIEVSYEWDGVEGHEADFTSVKKLSEAEISKLADSEWDYEETDGNGTHYMYAIVDERIDHAVMACELKHSDSSQTIHISNEILAEDWNLAENGEIEAGDIICIDYHTGAEYYDENNEAGLEDVSAVRKLCG